MTEPVTLTPKLTNVPDIALETERLHLRPPVPDDAARIASLVTHDVSRWMASWPDPCTVEFVADRIGKARKALVEGWALPLVVDVAGGEATIGMVEAFLSRDDPGRVTLSFWLGAAWHGRGYMTEAVGAVLRHLAADPAVRVVDGGAQLDNAGSIAVMTRLGMRPVGTRKVYAEARGRDEPCVFFEIEAGAMR